MDSDATAAQFFADAAQYLHALLQQAPSKAAANKLAGPLATAMRENDAAAAPLYLQAAARLLPILMPIPASNTGAAGASASTAKTSKTETEASMKNSHTIHEIVEAVGHAVTHVQPRSLIAQSGILPVLASLLPPAVNHNSLLATPVLSTLHTEFLQACVYAGHYSYAERLIGSTWPRPTQNVRNVLRYFYLRGVVHLGCGQLAMAARCFRTCLVVPADAVSEIAVAAWKKLVLVQCLLDLEQPTKLPSTIPVVIRRHVESTEKAVVAPAPEDATSIVHLVDNLETGESLQRNGGLVAYTAVCKAFTAMDKDKMATLLHEHAQLFTTDGNLGLAQQVADKVPVRQLVSWSHVYSAIPLAELATLLGLSTDEVQRLLIRVSLAKSWPIQVQGDMVSFPPLPTVGPETCTPGQTEELLALTQLVQKLDANLSASNKFAALARKESSPEGGPAGKGPSGPRGVEDI